MDDGEAFEERKRVLVEDFDRVEKAKRIAGVIRTAGAYRWVGLYDVDVQRGIVSNMAWDGAGPLEHPAFPITKGLSARAARPCQQ